MEPERPELAKTHSLPIDEAALFNHLSEHLHADQVAARRAVAEWRRRPVAEGDKERKI